MDNFSSELLEEMVKAPLVEKVVTEDGYVLYMGFPSGSSRNHCHIKRVTYVKDENTETWTTECSGSSRRYEYDWEDRAELQYGLYR